MKWIYNGGPVISLERIDALESVQLLHYATLEILFSMKVRIETWSVQTP
jgi:hypothetical protein